MLLSNRLGALSGSSLKDFEAIEVSDNYEEITVNEDSVLFFIQEKNGESVDYIHLVTFLMSQGISRSTAFEVQRKARNLYGSTYEFLVTTTSKRTRKVEVKDIQAPTDDTIVMRKIEYQSKTKSAKSFYDLPTFCNILRQFSGDVKLYWLAEYLEHKTQKSVSEYTSFKRSPGDTATYKGDGRAKKLQTRKNK